MRVIGYVRVSTGRQADDGLGLEIQEAGIRRWAGKHRHKLVKVFVDAGVSGANGLDTRLGLHDAIDLIRNRRAEALVVPRLDRLARDLILQEQVLRQVWDLGAEVFSVTEGEQDYLRDDPDDPSRALVRQLLGAIGQYERGLIRLRLRRGRERKAKKGQYAGGRPPLGYRASEGQLVPVADEQETIAEIRRLRTQGQSIRQIALSLGARGYRTKSGNPKWHPTQVARVLSGERAVPSGP